eukprot:COSAG05_NODE_1636_length_4365_cov_8.688467_4_plen_129_part_00
MRSKLLVALPYVYRVSVLAFCLNSWLRVFAGACFDGLSDLDFMRAFGNTGPFVRMISVISSDLRVFGFIAAVFLLASTSFFLINEGDKEAFALNQPVIGPAGRECSLSVCVCVCVCVWHRVPTMLTYV